jgi:hypothetical protein
LPQKTIRLSGGFLIPLSDPIEVHGIGQFDDARSAYMTAIVSAIEIGIHPFKVWIHIRLRPKGVPLVTVVDKLVRVSLSQIAAL